MDEQKDRKRQQARRPGRLGRAGKGKKEEPVMILQTSVPEGPAKKFKTPKTFEIFQNQIDGTKIKLKKDNLVDMKAKGGRAGLKGGGICKRGMNRQAIGKNS